MKLIPKIPLKDHYHKPSKEWVRVVADKPTSATVLVSGKDNIFKKVDKRDLLTYPEYLTQFMRDRRLQTNN